MELLEQHTLYTSPVVSVIEFRCLEEPHTTSRPEVTENYSICFVNKGNFSYRVGRQTFDFHTQTILHHNPGLHYVASHPVFGKDVCTSVRVAPRLLAEMRARHWRSQAPCDNHLNGERDCIFPAIASPTNTRLDYLQGQLRTLSQSSCDGDSRLKVDTLALDLASTLLHTLYRANRRIPVRLEQRQKQLHLESIERAKEFLHAHFEKEIKLSDIAAAACLSEYHFLRIFRSLTSSTPYRYLLDVRLQHALQLLRETNSSITEICFASGFQSLSHFISTFKKQFGASPSLIRRMPYRTTA